MIGADIAKLSLLESGWTGWNTPEAAASTTWRVKCRRLSLMLAGIHGQGWCSEDFNILSDTERDTGLAWHHTHGCKVRAW